MSREVPQSDGPVLTNVASTASYPPSATAYFPLISPHPPFIFHAASFQPFVPIHPLAVAPHPGRNSYIPQPPCATSQETSDQPSRLPRSSPTWTRGHTCWTEDLLKLFNVPPVILSLIKNQGNRSKAKESMQQNQGNRTKAPECTVAWWGHGKLVLAVWQYWHWGTEHVLSNQLMKLECLVFDRVAIPAQPVFAKSSETVANLRRILWPCVLRRVTLLTDASCFPDVTLWLHRPKKFKLFPEFYMTFCHREITSVLHLCRSFTRDHTLHWHTLHYIVYPFCTAATPNRSDKYCFFLIQPFDWLHGVCAM